MSLQTDEVISIQVNLMPEQIEKLRYYADLANVPISQFLREAGELLACEMAQYRTRQEDGFQAAELLH